MEQEELDFLVRFLIESDAIEGIDNDESKVRAQLAARLADGHASALRGLRVWADCQRLLRVSLANFIQELITEEQSSKGAPMLPFNQRGAFRAHNVELVHTNRHGEQLSRKSIGVSHERIASAMTDLVASVVKWQGERAHIEHPAAKVKFIAWFHWMYERIHPYADGNGRSGRALVYYLYRYANLEPFVFENIDKNTYYYPCFANDGLPLMERYFFGSFSGHPYIGWPFSTVLATIDIVL